MFRIQQTFYFIFWKNFCEAVGRRDLMDKQFIEGEEQLRIIEEIQNLFKTKTQEEWVDFFKNADACHLTAHDLFLPTT